MNWYKKAQLNKFATVDFWIDESDKITQPMHKLDICHDLSNFIFYKMNVGQKLGLKWDSIDPDVSSGDVFAPTGQINIYLENPNIKEGIIQNIVEKYNADKAGLIKLKFLQINKSGLRSDLNTARILIEENNTTDLQKIPTMNISNSNAAALIQLLSNEGMGQLDPVSGELNAYMLKNIIEGIDQNDFVMNSYTQDVTEEKIENGPTSIDFGRSYQQLSGYINKLREMVEYIITNNLPKKVINYG
jgi:hypothetical protein